MLRRIAVIVVLFLAAAFEMRPADAAPVSPRNPYRSFNISGVNYGSMRWERSHRSVRSRGYHRGLFFRRR
jgi:hypothetical protein